MSNHTANLDFNHCYYDSDTCDNHFFLFYRNDKLPRHEQKRTVWTSQNLGQPLKLSALTFALAYTICGFMPSRSQCCLVCLDMYMYGNDDNEQEYISEYK